MRIATLGLIAGLLWLSGPATAEEPAGIEVAFVNDEGSSIKFFARDLQVPLR